MGARFSWGLRPDRVVRGVGRRGAAPDTSPDAPSGEERRGPRGGEADVCAVNRGREGGLSDGTVRSGPRRGWGRGGAERRVRTDREAERSGRGVLTRSQGGRERGR